MDSEHEELEALQKWWKENGRMVVTGLVLGLGGVFGWTAWQNHQATQQEMASRGYQELLLASAQSQHIVALQQAKSLKEDFPDSGYAVLAALIAARAAYVIDDADETRRQLRWVIERASEPEIRDLARVRLAHLLFGEQDYDGASNELGEVSTESFAAEVEELRGDVNLAKGNTDGARDAYTATLAMAEVSPGRRDRVQMKLDDLGHIRVSTESE